MLSFFFHKLIFNFHDIYFCNKTLVQKIVVYFIMGLSMKGLVFS